MMGAPSTMAFVASMCMDDSKPELLPAAPIWHRRAAEV